MVQEVRVILQTMNTNNGETEVFYMKRVHIHDIPKIVLALDKIVADRETA